MNINALKGNPLALVFSYLDIKSRIKCSETCRLFRSTLIDPQYQTILWSKKRVSGFPAKSLTSPFVASVLDRTLAKPDEKAVAALEKHSGFALSFLSFGDFVISC
ncbi:MAG: F-box protein, partial [Verrucomicrobia bacterium]|nr:F-box protein [Verrucomicrobiota bacterium]